MPPRGRGRGAAPVVSMGPIRQEIPNGIVRKALLMQDPHASNVVSGAKKWEIRNWAPGGTVKEGDMIDIAQSKAAPGAFLVRGLVEFEKTITFTSPEEFMEHRDKHLWTWDDVHARLGAWKRK
eukprot:5389887-Pyramimonas_sp.AAC.1